MRDRVDISSEHGFCLFASPKRFGLFRLLVASTSTTALCRKGPPLADYGQRADIADKAFRGELPLWAELLLFLLISDLAFPSIAVCENVLHSIRSCVIGHRPGMGIYWRDTCIMRVQRSECMEHKRTWPHIYL